MTSSIFTLLFTLSNSKGCRSYRQKRFKVALTVQTQKTDGINSLHAVLVFPTNLSAVTVLQILLMGQTYQVNQA